MAQIRAARTPAGGWTKAQLAAWGVPWPPPKGWQDRLVDGICDVSNLTNDEVACLEISINRRLFRDKIAIGDDAAISRVVSKIAPGWDYVDATHLTIGPARPRIALAQYNPDSPSVS
jgi:hypothetical protein